MLMMIIETLSSNGLKRFKLIICYITSPADVDDDCRNIVLKRFEAVPSVIYSLTDVDDDHRDIVFKRV